MGTSGDRNADLAEIARLYQALPRVLRHHETPEYRARILQIRAHVDAWKARWGDDVTISCGKAPQFGREGR